MNKMIEHHDDESRLSIPEKLRDDIRGIYESSATVPPEMDRAIIDRAHQHFAREEMTQTKQRRIRWVALWKVAAAAAVVIFAFSLDLTKKPEPTTDRPVLTGTQASDIDLNGRVDILDAFTLARQIEKAGHVERSLSLRKQGWDINGDGRVDHSDVDIVALAAVRLDKGVL